MHAEPMNAIPSPTDPITKIDAAVLEDGAPAIPVDRRRGERRGTAIQVIRFTNERRQSPDRRLRSRRGFRRLPVEVPVEIRQGGEALMDRSVDLSVLGVSLADGAPLPIGALVRVTFTLPDDLSEFPISTWAQFVSGDPADAGDAMARRLRFVGLRACDARRMGRFFAACVRAGADEAEAPYPF